MNHELPKVSVVIPCFNYARFLREAVESVVGQTYTDYEILIVDDGSQDGTTDVANDLKRENPGISITVLSQENMGLPGARNTGIRHARGTYIQPLDADDKLHPEYLARVVAFMEAHPNISFAYSGFELFGELTEAMRAYAVDQRFDPNRLRSINYITVCALFLKSAWQAVGGYKEFMREGYEDWEFYLSLAEAGLVGGFVDGKLYLYRKHGGAMLLDSLKRHAALRHKLKTLHPNLYSPRLAIASPALAMMRFRVERFGDEWRARIPLLSDSLRAKLPSTHRLLKSVWALRRHLK